MAIMHPDNISDINMTGSERNFYEILKVHLPDTYHVFYSVRWYYEKNGVRVNSESDFVIFNPKYGYLTLEVKGGKSITKDGDRWTLYLARGETHNLKRSPFKQAEESMWYFKNYYREFYNQHYSGLYGYAVVFPFYHIDNDFGPEGPKELIIDKNDLNNIEKRIDDLFFYWRGQVDRNKLRIKLSEAQRKKFIDLINKRIALSAAAGALIEQRNNKLEKINRVQDNYLNLIKNYKRAFIKGGAGTGKTWMALKKAQSEAKEGKKVLITCSSAHLKEFLKITLRDFENIDSCTFEEIVNKNISNNHHVYKSIPENFMDLIDYHKLHKYDSIIIDEGQDFNEDWALAINMMLKDEDDSLLYVFYDDYQNVYNRAFNDKFLISSPPFLLNENIRNTLNIYEYAKTSTNLGLDVYPSTIEGANPDVQTVSSGKYLRRKINDVLTRLVHKEKVSYDSIVIISDKDIEAVLSRKDIGVFRISSDIKNLNNNEIPFYKVDEFKGLESDVVIFINNGECSAEELYVAYTRARYYLYELKFI